MVTCREVLSVPKPNKYSTLRMVSIRGGYGGGGGRGRGDSRQGEVRRWR